MEVRVSFHPPFPVPSLESSLNLTICRGACATCNITKALPTRFAPARLWKDTAALIAPLLLPAMNLQQQALYPRWHEVQVCTLPKVHTVKLPKLDPCNKVMASLLAARVLPKVAAFLESAPQWAYLPGRSAADALEAVCSHLQAVRSLVQSKSTTLVQRHRGAQPTKLAGGVSISLDIHKFFDSLNHAFLAEAMRLASFEPSEIALVLHLHEGRCRMSRTSTLILASGRVAPSHHCCGPLPRA